MSPPASLGDLQPAQTAERAPVPRRVADAVASAQTSHVLAQIERLRVLDAEARTRRLAPHLKAAVSAMRRTDWREAGRKAMAALDIDQDHPLASHIAAIAMENLGAHALAIDLYERTLRLAPEDPDVLRNLGSLASRMDMPQIAERWFRAQLARHPGDLDAVNDLAGVLRDQTRFDDAIAVIKPALLIAPENKVLWNTLGTILLDQGEFDQALTFLDEAVRLDPGFARGWHNRATALMMSGRVAEFREAITCAHALNTSAADAPEIAFAKAFAHLMTGDLATGWELYEVRNAAALGRGTPCYAPGATPWNGADDLGGSSLVLFGEQGLGDEVLFLEAAHDLQARLGPQGRLAIVVTDRLVPLVSRSFPDAAVHPIGYASVDGRTHLAAVGLDWAGWDRVALMGSAFGALRRSAADFPRRASYLSPDPARVAHWRQWLETLGPGPKVGLSWKSSMMGGARHKIYLPLAAWRPLVETPGVRIVDIQYGDTASDLATMRQDWGVDVVTPPGIDLRNHLDDLAALLRALDLVVSLMNATLNIAGAVGTRCWVAGKVASWAFFGEDGAPTYPSVRVRTAEREGGADAAMAAMAADLRAHRF